jgi:hypothetical protein
MRFIQEMVGAWVILGGSISAPGTRGAPSPMQQLSCAFHHSHGVWAGACAAPFSHKTPCTQNLPIRDAEMIHTSFCGDASPGAQDCAPVIMPRLIARRHARICAAKEARMACRGLSPVDKQVHSSAPSGRAANPSPLFAGEPAAKTGPLELPMATCSMLHRTTCASPWRAHQRHSRLASAPSSWAKSTRRACWRIILVLHVTRCPAYDTAEPDMALVLTI